MPLRPAPTRHRRRLEELSERRQSQVQRVKAAQRDRDSLAGDKAAAELYLAKERECLGAQSVLAQVMTHNAKVGGQIEGVAGFGSNKATLRMLRRLVVDHPTSPLPARCRPCLPAAQRGED